MLMSSPHGIVMGPNGNGAVFEAVRHNKKVLNVIENLEYVQVIGVDNVLNKILDPVFIGFTHKHGYEAAMKSCVKIDATEKVGVVVKKDGKYDVIEYTELPVEKGNERVDGQLKYGLGNILNFILKTSKLLELC